MERLLHPCRTTLGTNKPAALRRSWELNILNRFVFLCSWLAVLVVTASAVHADEKTLYKGLAGLCIVTVSADDQWHTLMVRRSSESGSAEPCRVGKAETLDILTGAFAKLAERGTDLQYGSVFLGRIEYYDWLSRHLVDRSGDHPDWSGETGRPVEGKEINDLANRILSEPAILDFLNPAAKTAGYTFTGFSCEKVLVSGPTTKDFEPDWTPEGRHAPYDAMCWLSLEPGG